MKNPSSHLPLSLFWKHLRDLIQPEQKLQEFLVDTLNISRSSAYERINGVSTLKTDEFFRILAAQPEVAMRITSQSRILGDYHMSQSVQFKDQEGLQSYLSNILEFFTKAVDQGATLSYTALDYPLFYFLSSPDILTYKFNYWSNRLFDNPIKALPSTIYRKSEAIFDLYLQMESTEIWSFRVLERQVEQLELMQRRKFLPAHDCQRLIQDFVDLKAQANQWKREGEKDHRGRFRVSTVASCNMHNAGLLHFPDGSEVWMGAITSCHFLRASYSDMVQKFKEDFEVWMKLVEEHGVKHET